MNAEAKGQFSFNKKQNKNGQLLQDIIDDCHLVPLHTKFQMRGKLWTYTSPDEWYQSQTT